MIFFNCFFEPRSECGVCNGMGEPVSRRREEASPFLFLVAGDKHMEGRDLVLKRSDEWEASRHRAPLSPRNFSGTIFEIAGICCAMVASFEKQP